MKDRTNGVDTDRAGEFRLLREALTLADLKVDVVAGFPKPFGFETSDQMHQSIERCRKIVDELEAEIVVAS